VRVAQVAETPGPSHCLVLQAGLGLLNVIGEN